MAATDQLSTTAARRWSSHVGDALLARLARRAAVDGADGAIAVEAPFTGETLGTCPTAHPTTCAPPATRRAAQPAWAATPVAPAPRSCCASTTS